tara:strand:- start:67 stop:234 length:168 start_codon:yes stop_codon:yes gene_type:complete
LPQRFIVVIFVEPSAVVFFTTAVAILDGQEEERASFITADIPVSHEKPKKCIEEL